MYKRQLLRVPLVRAAHLQCVARGQIVRGAYMANQLANHLFKLASLGIVRFHDKVGAPLHQKPVCNLGLPRRVHGDGIAALLLGHLHARCV